MAGSWGVPKDIGLLGTSVISTTAGIPTLHSLTEGMIDNIENLFANQPKLYR